MEFIFGFTLLMFRSGFCNINISTFHVSMSIAFSSNEGESFIHALGRGSL